MDGMSSVSNLSSTSSRSEHMAYLMSDLNLDRPTAMLMYRAERLQEKGQLQQALRYYEQILLAKPDCEEASVNSRMIRAELAEQSQQRLPTVREQAVVAEPQRRTVPPPLQTADLEVTFTCIDSEEFDVYWDEQSLETVALQKARNLLKEYNINTPFVSLVSNNIQQHTPSVNDDPWMNVVHKCRALVRVTFPPPSAGLVGSARAGSARDDALVDFAGLIEHLNSLGPGLAPLRSAGPVAPSIIVPDFPAQLSAVGVDPAMRSTATNSEPGKEPSVHSQGETATSHCRGAGSSMLEQLRSQQSLFVDSSIADQGCAAAAATEFEDGQSRWSGTSSNKTPKVS